MSRSLRLITVLAFATLSVAACGKRGALEVPASQDNAPSVQPKPDEKPHRPFVLDRLLQ